METQKGVLGICHPENSKHSMENEFGKNLVYKTI